MNVLITGGTGTISSGIAKESVKQGYNTFAITRGNNSYRNIENVKYIKANVWNKDEMKKVLKNLNIDIVVECLVYNCEQLEISLDNFANRCKQYIFISTAGIYNREKGKVSENVTEKDVFEWEYTKNKIECEEKIKKFFSKRINKFTIIRPFVTYGDYRIPYPIVCSRAYQWTIFERIEKGYPIVGCNNVKFAIVHIEDFSYAVVKLFNNELAYNEDFHIAETGKEIYWDDVIKVAGSLLNKNVNIIHIPLEVFKNVYIEIYDELKWNKTTELLVDDSKIKSVVKEFKQSVTIEKGLQSTISEAKKTYLNNKILDMNWWYKCDLILIYSYLRNKLNEEEKIIIKNYIKEISFKIKLKILFLYIKVKLKWLKKLIKDKLKFKL